MNLFPKTLILSRSIPPAPTGTGVIIGNLVRQFKPDEMIVLGAYYVACPRVEWREEWPTLLYATLQPPDGWRGARWIRWAQFPWLLLRALWTLLAHRCQAIMAVFPDETFLLAGYLLAWLTGKPLFAYFHNTYLEQFPKSRLANWLQPRVFTMAQHVFVMSEGMQRLYAKNYPGLRCSPLLHTFNESLPNLCVSEVETVQTPLELLLFGNIGESNVEAATRFAQLVQAVPDVHLTLLTGTQRSYLEKLGFRGSKVTVDVVSRSVLLQRLSQAHIVLLPHGFHGSIAGEEIATIFPTKVIDALISQRPILAHLPKDCFLAEFLRNHDCALIVDEPDLEALRNGLERLRDDRDLRSHLVRQSLLAANQFQASSVAGYLREVMENAREALPTRKRSGQIGDANGPVDVAVDERG
ncbi:MAG: glycosyltransferase [Pyrinomonadaceae bacterium]|nr:glycosyltransferase [Pyrinomonadaceae bacterium]